MSDDEKEQQQEELTVVHDLRSHKVYKAVDKKENTKRSRTSQKGSQTSLDAKQTSELVQQLQKLEIDNAPVFEEEQVGEQKRICKLNNYRP